MQYLQNQGRMGMGFLLLMSLMLSQGCVNQADDIAELRAQADQGDAKAQTILGTMYHNGKA